MASHRTVRQTAIHLARAGAPALRFDFYGAGDSAGESSDGSPSRWLLDVGQAAAELRRRHQSADTSLVGVRLGATLALLHLQNDRSARAGALVLWDPVIDGRRYAEELTTLQRTRFGEAGGEVLGFPFGDRSRSELEEVDLLQLQKVNAGEVLVVETGAARDETRALVDRLRQLGATVEHRAFDESPMWHEPNKSVIPMRIVQSIVTWIRAHS
jgi:pimeloyl-ACP methyl ester carboxylesterase